MTAHSAKIRDVVAKALDGVAEVTVTDQKVATVVHVRSLVSNQAVDRTIAHGMGYTQIARLWAQGLRKTIHLPAVGTEVTVGFEGQKRELNELLFGLFEAGELREGLQKVTPGGATIVLKPMEMGKRALGHAIMEIGLIVANSVAIPLFVNWLYEKWRSCGARKITVKINRRFYEFEQGQLTKAIEEAIEFRTEQKK
jgi:hypothetical protein